MNEPAAEWVNIGELTPWAANPRKNDHAVKQVAASIERFGFASPIIARPTGEVIAGHTRLKAAQQLKLEEVPVRYLDLTDTEARALAIADNRLGELAEWDDEGLAEVMRSIQADGGDLGDLGWDDEALAEALGDEPAPPADDEAPEVQAEVHSRVGEVYELGPHRLICGDALDSTTLDVLLAGRRVGLTFTDPPYGVSFQSGMSKGGTATRFDKLANDDKILPVAPVVWERMGDNSAAFIWTSHQVYPVWRAQFADYYKGTVIWSKGGGGIGDLEGSYATDYEMALFCVKGRALRRTKRTGAVWSIGKDSANSYLHPTQKPIALAAKATLDFSDKGDVVLDLFGGSGSTLMACASTARVAAIVELDPRYCDVIRRRWTRYATENNIDPGPGALDG